ncbi:uncharacterized protein PHACADRAFT_32263 [Phanerochaete carnosa HHB-10118-sp]|uniref:Uncharacterized protein n=1 Tax=Phanerochaete carnosa (strain HHB-10118-sp) TaxID=650164 RepID=K5VIZ9_PHACS|nr:uncharacterized protein PHACADRAFT_32263 [Phanerochaete carnosa HHB-10118-sp]EKM51273.1 hypothetical protein PHACADRAFT_32263 [Phanerochaete carnosa HHB-10118-sp]
MTQLACQAWKKCTVHKWNLSHKLLTDSKMKRELQKYLATHSNLRNEIEAKIDHLSSIDEEPSDGEDKKDELCSSEVLLSAVVEHEFNIDVGGNLTHQQDGLATSADIETWNGQLMSASTGDNLDAYRDDDTTWNEYIIAAQHYML